MDCGCEGGTKRNVYIGLRLLYVWGLFVYINSTLDLRINAEGLRMEVLHVYACGLFFVCVRVNPLSVGF